MNEENKPLEEDLSLEEVTSDMVEIVPDANEGEKSDPVPPEKTKDQVAIEDAFKEVSQNKKHNKKSEKKSKAKESAFQKEIDKKDNPEEVKKEIKRLKPDPNVGLSVEQVIERINKGYVNKTVNGNVKTYSSIFISNICTFFNILCVAVAISLIIAGSFKNLMFMLVVFCNTAIGIFQEIRAKRTIEKLSLLTAPTAKVIRGGSEYEITTAEVVIDDIVVLKNGKQIVADAIIVDGSVEVNESLLTGESVNIKKSVGDILYSGSFISSGSCKARVDKVGEDCYVEQLSQQAKQYKKPKSELFNSLNLTIKVIGFIIIPLAIGMYINNYMNTGGNFSETVAKSAGAVISMIPSGMFLLCSIALTVSVIRLAQRKALVQDLYCVEMLARVNVLCLDKTGTITDGTMRVYNFIELQNKSGLTLKRIMGSFLSAQNDNNQTSQCLVNYFGYNKELKPQATLPFSSTRKLSAVTFDGLGTYILGAPEFVLPNLKDGKIKDMIEQYAKDGYRVLVLANCSGQIANDNLPNTNRNPVAVIVLEDRIREDAIETIKWFKENDVKIKIISGDNPLTVAEIAKRVGVTDTESFINLEGLNNAQVISAANKYTVFGRVTPEQKAILVKAMKAQGNTVAMTGDGVNDILALKEADCSIAMASGSEAVRSVSHMVLLDSKFSSMPQAVFEGRRVINNIQKSSALFFMKTIFTILFSVFILATGQVYPFSPFQMYMLEFFVIGIPSFFLALQPNKNRIKGRFIYNLFKNATPGALTLFINCIAIYLFVLFTQGTWDDTLLISSMCTIVVTFTGLVMLLRLCSPLSTINGILFTTMTAICFGLTIFASDFFEITAIGLQNTLFLIILILISGYIISICAKIFDKIKIGAPPQPKISAWVDQQYSNQERKDK